MEMREIRQDVLKVMEDSRKEGKLPQGTLVRPPCSFSRVALPVTTKAVPKGEVI
jgi:hypothetical protein